MGCERIALTRDLSRAGGPRDPPLHQGVIATFPFLVSIPTYLRLRRNTWPRVLEEGGASASGPVQARSPPDPRAGRREAPAAAAARRIPPSPHPPRLAASRIHPSSPHRRISPTRTGGQPRPQQDPRDLCPPSPICISFLAGLQLFFVLFPSHLLDLILLNLNKSSL